MDDGSPHRPFSRLKANSITHGARYAPELECFLAWFTGAGSYANPPRTNVMNGTCEENGAAKAEVLGVDGMRRQLTISSGVGQGKETMVRRDIAIEFAEAQRSVVGWLRLAYGMTTLAQRGTSDSKMTAAD